MNFTTSFLVGSYDSGYFYKKFFLLFYFYKSLLLSDFIKEFLFIQDFLYDCLHEVYFLFIIITLRSLKVLLPSCCLTIYSLLYHLKKRLKLHVITLSILILYTTSKVTYIYLINNVIILFPLLIFRYVNLP